jgi:acetyl-CoA C-acetyltransferase
METAVIIEGARTPIGRFVGSFADTPAVELGTLAVQEAMRRADVVPEQIDQTILGHARQAGNGPNTGRQVSVRAGVPIEVAAYNVNMACGSGMKAVQLAAQQIALGDAEVVLAGGMENMSRVPYLLPEMRRGHRLGDTQIVDAMYRDGPPRPALRAGDGRDRGEPGRPLRHHAGGARTSSRSDRSRRRRPEPHDGRRSSSRSRPRSTVDR